MLNKFTARQSFSQSTVGFLVACAAILLIGCGKSTPKPLDSEAKEEVRLKAKEMSELERKKMK